MKYRKLGRTGFDVSEIGHGLWGMSGWTGSEDRESLEAMQLSIDLGCNFFDTAWAYGNGKSDALLGQILAKNRGKRLYAASKIPPLNGKWPATSKYNYSEVFPLGHVVENARMIREKLGTDAIDLLQFHVWDDSWADEPEFRETVQKLKSDGLIKYFGLSLNRWEPDNGIKALHTGLVDAVQVIYNIFDQNPEDALFPICRMKDTAVIARVPFDEGTLTGTLTVDSKWPAGDWRNTYFVPENLKSSVEHAEALRPLIPAGNTMAEMALRFILSNPDVSTTIPGMRKLKNVEANCTASGAGPLAANLLKKLRAHRWDRNPTSWSQ
jgi:aryl-alcohol dehydrogenase-like predicted oxidoreductase